jgi:3-phenylpropionate/trans-cinnamate dioxygenase ferredoxin subunit
VAVETNDIEWVVACAASEIAEEDVIRFDHAGASYAVYRIAEGFFASDGCCFVLNREIECPLHQGRFDIPTGKPKSPPVCVHLKTYPVRIERGEVLLGVPPQTKAAS